MKFLAIPTALLLAVSSVSAAPAIETRQFAAQITFYGAADAKYSLSIPADGSVVRISTFSLSIPPHVSLLSLSVLPCHHFSLINTPNLPTSEPTLCFQDLFPRRRHLQLQRYRRLQHRRCWRPDRRRWSATDPDLGHLPGLLDDGCDSEAGKGEVNEKTQQIIGQDC